MTFRYRQLKASRDAEAVESLRTQLVEAATSREERREATGRAEAEAPLQVEATEGEGSLAELEALLRERTLMPSDLVFSNGGWTTFADAPEFCDLCAELGDSRAFGQGLGSIFNALLRLFR